MKLLTHFDFIFGGAAWLDIMSPLPGAVTADIVDWTDSQENLVLDAKSPFLVGFAHGSTADQHSFAVAVFPEGCLDDSLDPCCVQGHFAEISADQTMVFRKNGSLATISCS